mmetsp:Transcript_10844/g.32954  ORF Transcript_10844/g.32954 Transcript_10844/m.32954 type:complete len:507 (-) Transcript_10844:44-1564(-)
MSDPFDSTDDGIFVDPDAAWSLAYRILAILGVAAAVGFTYQFMAIAAQKKAGIGPGNHFDALESGPKMNGDEVDLPDADDDFNGIKISIGCIPFNPPPARVMASMSVDMDTGDLYLYGGLDMKGLRSDLQIFRQQTFNWEKAEQDEAYSQPPGARACTDLLRCGRYLVLIGGATRTRDFSDDVFAYDIAENRWIQFEIEGTKPAARNGALLVAHEDIVFMFGGISSPNRETGECEVLNDTWILDCTGLAIDGDQARLQWLPAPILDVDADASEGQHYPLPRYGHCGAIVGGMLVSLGGATDAGPRVVPAGEVEYLDLDSETTVAESKNGGEAAAESISTWVWKKAAVTGEGPGKDMSSDGIGTGARAHAAGTSRLLVVTPNMDGIFNELAVLELSTVPMRWEKVRLEWVGDWSMIPGPRVSFCSVIDTQTGVIFCFGGSADPKSEPDDMLVTIHAREALGMAPPEDEGEEGEEGGEGAEETKSGGTPGAGEEEPASKYERLQNFGY